VWNFPMPSGNKQDTLEVSVNNIAIGFGDGSLQTVSVDSSQNPTTFNAVIDSTYPFLYLPQAACNKFQQLLGLQFDNTTGMYTLNDTQRAKNIANVNHISLTLSDSKTQKVTTSIELPYTAFDLNASWPIYQTSQHYFPIRPSTTGTNVIGRTVLQEMYIIANYENQTFALAKAAQHQVGVTQIQSIYNSTTSPDNNSGSSKLSGGAIAGIVIGALAGILLLCLLGWWLYRRRQNEKKKRAEKEKEIELAEEAKHAERRHTVETVTSQYSGATELDSGRPGHSRNLSELSSEEGHARVVNPPGVIYELDDPSTVVDHEDKTDTSAWGENQSSFAANELSALRGETPVNRGETASVSPEMTRPSPGSQHLRSPDTPGPVSVSPAIENGSEHGMPDSDAQENTLGRPSPP
jgi:aspartyl protease